MARGSDPDLDNAWRELLLDFQASQVTVAEFCDLHEISTGQFYYWKRKLLCGSEPLETPARVSAFLPVRVDAQSGSTASSVVIDLPDSTCIQIPADQTALILAVLTTLAHDARDTPPGDLR